MFFRASVTAAFLLLNAVIASPVESRWGSSDLIVDLGYAKYQGFYDAAIDSDAWLGVRFAAPPDRFQKAVAPTSNGSDTLIQAATLPPHCAQVSASAGQPVSTSSPGAEDCLFLDVYVPTNVKNSGKQASVIVWIYGGGYGYGYPDAFGNVSNVIGIDGGKTILVALQYRTDVFGFLAGKEVQERGHPNLGIYDQILGMQWVHDHIHLFGGNNQHVTVWGESAGGGSTMLLTMSFGGALGTSLWNATISNSPYLPLQYNHDDSVPQGYYDSLVSLAGCSGQSDTFACLSNKPYETVYEAAILVNHNTAPYGTWGPAPVTDGVLLLGTPSEVLFPGQVNAEYMFVGHTSHEGSNFVPPDLNSTAEFEAWFEQLYPSPNSLIRQLVYAFYPEPAQSNGLYTTQSGRAAAIYGDTTFRCPAYWIALSFPNGKGWKYIDNVGTGTHGSDLEIFFEASQTPGYDLASARAFEVGSLASFWQHFDPAYNPALHGMGYAPYDAASHYQQLLYTMTSANVTYAVLDDQNMPQPIECAMWRAIGPLVPI